MSEELYQEGERLLDEIDKLSKFEGKHGVLPRKSTESLTRDLRAFSGRIQPIENPATLDEVYRAELQRRLEGEATGLEVTLRGKSLDFNEVLAYFGIPKEDTESLGPWLRERRDEVLDIVDRLYTGSEIREFELDVPRDIPAIARASVELADVHIQKYHRRIGKLIQQLTQVGDFLRDISATTTRRDRSYFQPLTRILAIAVAAITFQLPDGTLRIRDDELIRVYGHEGMGHGLQNAVTHASKLPAFLRKESLLTYATAESIAQFYERRIFEDLKEAPEVQEDLGIRHMFAGIYQNAKDTELLEEFKRNAMSYAIAVLTDKSLGAAQDTKTIKRKIELLEEVTLDSRWPTSVIEGNRHSFDSEDNLSFELTKEIQYCARPVERALQAFARHGVAYEGIGRSLIDRTLLSGFWTPIGYVQNAEAVARNGK